MTIYRNADVTHGELRYYGGNGYDGIEEDGFFEVIYGDKEQQSKEFNRLSEARKFYNGINEEKGLWDRTHGLELLECHYKPM